MCVGSKARQSHLHDFLRVPQVTSERDAVVPLDRWRNWGSEELVVFLKRCSRVSLVSLSSITHPCIGLCRAKGDSSHSDSCGLCGSNSLPDLSEFQELHLFKGYTYFWRSSRNKKWYHSEMLKAVLGMEQVISSFCFKMLWFCEVDWIINLIQFGVFRV